MWDFLTWLLWKLLIWALPAIIFILIAIWVVKLTTSFFKWLRSGTIALFDRVIENSRLGISYVGDSLALDTLSHREKVASELDESAKKCEESGDPESLKNLKRAAQCPDSFKRSYALDALGRLGNRAADTVTIQVKGLASSDPFVREAAAHALYRMRRQAAPARSALVEVLRKRRSEGTARYAVLALEQIGGLTEEDLRVLHTIALAKNSYAAREAAELFERLTGRSPHSSDPAAPNGHLP